MKIEWDFKEFTDFAENLQNITQLDNTLKKATKDIAKI